MPWDMDVRDADWQERSPDQLDALERREREIERQQRPVAELMRVQHASGTKEAERPRVRLVGADRADRADRARLDQGALRGR